MIRVSLINLNLIFADAIGTSIINQARFFQRRGDLVKIYVQDLAQDVPSDIVPLCQPATLADLISRRDEHFAHSDLYVYHYPGRYPLVESIRGLERGAVIFYYHNITPPDLWGSTFEREHLQHSLDSVQGLASYADLIVTDSAFNAEQLIQAHGCEAKRVRILPLAVSLDLFRPGPRDAALVRLHSLENKQVILFVGRMAGNKRIDLLIRALQLVQPKASGAVLLLAGDDRGNPAIQQTVTQAKALAKELGVVEKVIFTGPVEALAAYYRLASVYASASLHEGFGVPLIEAMASGVPVVASRATAHPWVLGDAGLLTNPGDAPDIADKITQILTDPQLSDGLTRRGLARAAEFSLPRYEAGWQKIVADATAGAPGRQLRSEAPIQPRSTQASPAFLDVEMRRLAADADVMLRGYKVQSQLPVVGRAISWIRRNLTYHVREMYLDPIIERQVAFNHQTVLILKELVQRSQAELPSPEVAQPQKPEE